MSMRIIFLGAPGAGKGTQSEIVSAEYGIPAVSTGAIIREAIAKGTKMGLSAKSYAEKGLLVPDDVVIGIIKDRLAADDCKNGFILDGFPRTVAQAEALDQMGVEIDLVISIEVADDDIVKRMSGRRVCGSCGASYHTIYKPSKSGEQCERCGSDLTIRADDKPDVVLERLYVYHEMTEPLKEFYKAKGKCVEVQGQEILDDTSALVREQITKVFGK